MERIQGSAVLPRGLRVAAVLVAIEAWLFLLTAVLVGVIALGVGLLHLAGLALLLVAVGLGALGLILRRGAQAIRRLSSGWRTVLVIMHAIWFVATVSDLIGLIRPAGYAGLADSVLECGAIAVYGAVLYFLIIHPAARRAFAVGLDGMIRTIALDPVGGPVLIVEDLTVTFPTADGEVHAVRGLSFTVNAGETLGIVGESGSGKSVSMLTLMGLSAGADISGTALFRGVDLVPMRDRELRDIRGAEIGMIFQDPLSSLHPHYRVGWQIVEAIQAHSNETRDEARARAIDLLQQVGIPQPEKRIDNYPHELSGGMRQRAMIAMALSLSPTVLIADEPTTALDATVQAQIIELMERLQQELGMALIMITHDLGVIAEIADRVVVMYAGRAVENADRRALYYSPHHPYTLGLLGSIPSSVGADERLRPIVGQPPSLINLPSGCAFHPRCPFAMDRCIGEDPELQTVPGDTPHSSACWLPSELLGNSAEMAAERHEYASQHRTEKTAKLPGVRAAAELLAASGASPTP